MRDENCADIVSINLSSGGEPTLRSLIGELKSNQFNKIPLFMSMDDHYITNEGVIFQFMPHVADEAMMMIRNLIPYFRDTKDNCIESYFEMEAVTAAKNYKWDTDKNCIICQSDVNMEADEDTDIFGMSAASAFLQNTSMDTLESSDTQARPALPANPAPNGMVGAYFSSNDSISTLGNTVVILMATYTNTVSIGHETENNDNASTISGVTSVTAKDLLEANGGNI